MKYSIKRFLNTEKPKINPKLKISKPKGNTVSKLTLGMKAKRAFKKGTGRVMNFLEGPRRDYTKWNENIRKGTPQKNLE